MTPSGGGLDALGAMQDVLTLLVLPTALLLLIQFFAHTVEELDATTAESQRVEADRAIDKALNHRRTVLDGIIHDRVMTTLVAAVQTDQPARRGGRPGPVGGQLPGRGGRPHRCRPAARRRTSWPG